MGERLFGILVLTLVGTASACGNDPIPIDSGPSCTAMGTKKFAEVCRMNEDCESCLCVLFGHEHGCTKTCTTAADCTDPAFKGGCKNNVCQPF
jgi:hypothetical protein